MKIYPSIEGFNYNKQSYDDYLEDTLNLVGLDGWMLENLGICSDGVNSIYGLSYGDINNPTIFATQPHGLQEWRTCYWIREFAKELSNPRMMIHKYLMDEIKKKFHFYFIPCLNPHGYINNVRYNANGVDLNRNFNYYWDEFIEQGGEWGTKGDYPFSEIESQIVKSKVEELRPIMFLDLHTWGNEQGATNKLTSVDHQDLYWFGRDSVRSIQLSQPDTTFFWAPPDNRPTCANWASTVLSNQGIHPFVCTPESGGGMSEYKQAGVGMTMMFIYIMQMSNFLENRSLIIK